MDIPRPKSFYKSENLPFLIRLVLFILWPLISIVVLGLVALLLVIVWPVIPFRFTIKLKN